MGGESSEDLAQNGHFDGDNVTWYAEAYKDKMWMRGIYPWQGDIQTLQGS